MKTRILHFDAARGLTVLLMPAVHTVMLYSQAEVQHSWLGILLTFIAEGPGAQLFMFLMGMSVMISRTKSVKQVTQRALILLTAGYVLNIFRMVLPAKLHVLPASLVNDYIVYRDRSPLISLLLTGDILHFAAIAFPFLFLISRLNKPALIAIILYFTIAISSPFLWGIHGDKVVIDHISGLFFSDGFRAFFPVFPWLCYPLAGVVAGHFYHRIKPAYINSYFFKAGIIFLAAGIIVSIIQPANWDKDFYRSGPGRTVWQTGFVLLWLCLAQVFVRHYSESVFYKLLSFCSKNITIIYFVQWILIAWGTGIAGYRALGMGASIIALVLTTSVSLVIAWITQWIKAMCRNHRMRRDGTNGTDVTNVIM